MIKKITHILNLRKKMKNLYFICVSLLLAAFSVQAEDNNVFRHYSLSVGVGTTGVTGDLGTMVTDHLGLRGGVDYMPNFTYNTWLDMSFVNQNVATAADQYGVQIPANILEQYGLPDKVQVEGKYDNFTGHALLDIHPVKSSGFRFTVGAYFGKKDGKLISAYNKEPGVLKNVADFNARNGVYSAVPKEYGELAAKLGEYNLMPDAQGNANAYITVNDIRPYVGLGFGRAVPKSRINCQFDLGVQFWGHPKVYNGVNGTQLTAEGAKGEDGGVLKIISDVSVFPVISLRLSGRIF